MAEWWDWVLNGLWLIIVTMTTVGFREAYPTTHLGRLLGFVACVLGMLLMSLIVVSLTTQSEFTSTESKAFDILQRDAAIKSADAEAVKVIKCAFRLKNVLLAMPPSKRPYVRKLPVYQEITRASADLANQIKFIKIKLAD